MNLERVMTMRAKAKVWMLACVLPVVAGGPANAAADAASTKQVMLVATYHMGNPGADLHNVKADDVLTPKRQAELDAVAEALTRFAPTRLAVEWPSKETSERYAAFLAGTAPESRNEVVQLGFRLAKRLRLRSVEGLDVPGDFPFEAVQAWAKANGREADIEAMMKIGAAEVEKATALQATSTVGGILRHMNDPAEIARNHSFYPAFLGFGSGDEQPGAALLAAWYGRNLGICAKLVQALAPGDRAVVFFGQGHVYLLRQCLAERPDVRLVDSVAYLPE
jgi:hypothetical protein